MCSSTTFSSSRRRLQRAKPSGAAESVSAISFASAAPSKMRGRAELGLYLRVNTASNPSSTSWRLVRSILAMLVSSAAAIRLSLQPSPASDTSAFKRMRAFVSSCAERLPLLINSSSWPRSSAVNRTTYFLTAISFPATNHLHRWLAATEIQKLPSFSMTGATRLLPAFGAPGFSMREPAGMGPSHTSRIRNNRPRAALAASRSPCSHRRTGRHRSALSPRTDGRMRGKSGWIPAA